MDSEFSFGPSVNALVGIMGSGKSSVMDAISFALYGTFPVHTSGRVRLDDLIMKRPQQKKSACVELDFEANGKVYTVKRSLELGKGSSAEIREEGRLMDVDPKKVTEHVERLLKMDYGLFSRAVYSEQNNIDYFLTIPRGKRTEHIDRLLRLDRFEKARGGAVNLENKLRTRAEEKARLAGDMEKEGMQERMEKLMSEIKTIEVEEHSLSGQLNSASAMRRELGAKLAALEEKRARLSSVSGSMEGHRAALAEIARSLKEKSSHLEGLDHAALEKSLPVLAAEIAAMELQAEQREKSVQSLREKVASTNTEMRLIQKELEKLEGLGAKCPTCDSEVTPEKKSRIAAPKRSAIERLREEANSSAGKASEEKQALEALEKSLEEKRESRLKLERQKEDFSSLGRLEKRRAETEVRMEAITLEKAGLELEMKDSGMEKIREELQQSASLEGSLSARLRAGREMKNEKSSQLQDMLKRDLAMKRYAQEAKETGERARKISVFTGVLSETQGLLREEFVKTVNSAMSAVWTEIYPYGDYSEVRLAFDGDYVLQLRHNEEWVPVEGVASGGERSLASLALRIAFSLAFIPNLKWLILDEPTHNLDSAAVKKLAETLKEKMGRFTEQVFIITHEERITEGLPEQQVHRLERDKAANGATVVNGQ